MEGKARKIQDAAVIPSLSDAKTNIPTNKRIPPRFLLANCSKQNIREALKISFLGFAGNTVFVSR